MTTEPKAKQKESLDAMRNASKHIQTLFTKHDFMNNSMGSVANGLLSIARQCGELTISAYEAGSWKQKSLKKHLEDLAAKLEKDRT